MGVVEGLAVVGGAALALLVIVDVFLTTLHPDIDGVVAAQVQRGVWQAFLAVERRRRHERRVMALAGPVMMATTFLSWVTLFVVGYASVVWPFLDTSFRAEPELEPLGFTDALYFAGGTFTVLGHGDIAPLTGIFQFLTVAAALSGFAMLTGTVAYLIEVLSSLDDRVRMAVRIRADAAGGLDGVTILAKWLDDEELGDLRDRLETWADLLRDAQDKLQRFPMVALCFRSVDIEQDPEPAARVAAEVAMAARLLAADHRYRRLRPAVRSLDLAVTRFMVVTGSQYLRSGVVARLRAGEPEPEDRSKIDDLRRRLQAHFGCPGDSPGEERDHAAALACRSRLYLGAFHGLTSSEMPEGEDEESAAEVAGEAPEEATTPR